MRLTPRAVDNPRRQRIVGALVLVLLGALALPWLLEQRDEEPTGLLPKPIPEAPEAEFRSRIVPLDGEAPRATPPAAPATAAEAAPEPGSEAAAAALAHVGVTAWVVQLGSFASPDNAEKLVARLRAGGYPAFVEKVYTAEGVSYRVRVGPELLRRNAERLRDRIESEVELKGIVIRYP